MSRSLIDCLLFLRNLTCVSSGAWLGPRACTVVFYRLKPALPACCPPSSALLPALTQSPAMLAGGGGPKPSDHVWVHPAPPGRLAQRGRLGGVPGASGEETCMGCMGCAAALTSYDLSSSCLSSSLTARSAPELAVVQSACVSFALSSLCSSEDLTPLPPFQCRGMSFWGSLPPNYMILPIMLGNCQGADARGHTSSCSVEEHEKQRNAEAKGMIIEESLVAAAAPKAEAE